MTAFVLDASVTAAWLLPDESTAHTRKLYAMVRRDEVEPQAPQLWMWECANIIANGVRHNRIPEAAIEGLWGVLDAVRHRVDLHDLAPAQHKASLGMAVDLGLSAHDAGYLWLARSLKLPIATFDRRLSEAAGQSGIDVLDLSTL